MSIYENEYLHGDICISIYKWTDKHLLLSSGKNTNNILTLAQKGAPILIYSSSLNKMNLWIQYRSMSFHYIAKSMKDLYAKSEKLNLKL